jgi:phage-related protein
MKAIATVLLLFFTLTLSAQENVYRFQATKVNINKKGERIQTSTVDPTQIIVDLAAGTLTLETSNAEIRELLQEQLVMHIDRQMGEIGPEYSLQLDQFIFAHFYLNMGMIMFTRNDIHPLEWGIQFTEVTKL